MQNENLNPITVGSRVVYHGRYPWHDYYAVVIGEDPSFTEFGHTSPAWIVKWEGDQYFPERAEVVSRIRKYMSQDAFHAVGGTR